MFEEPIINEIRKTRDKIAAEHNYDVHKLFEHWRERENVHQDRLVTITRNKKLNKPNNTSSI